MSEHCYRLRRFSSSRVGSAERELQIGTDRRAIFFQQRDGLFRTISSYQRARVKNVNIADQERLGKIVIEFAKSRHRFGGAATLEL